MLDCEEHIEQAHFFGTLVERLDHNIPLQEQLAASREEALATTKLPLAIDFLLSELTHSGVISTAMARLGHYFTPFQTFVISEAENEGGRFDMRIGLNVLRHEAEYRSKDPTRQGVFIFQFETLCRNRLRYDPGLAAIAADPIYDSSWREWILIVRRQIGIIDFADLVYVRSEYYHRIRSGKAIDTKRFPVLFGEKEGKIASANRHKDPLLLFAAFQRHLGYPPVPRSEPVDSAVELLPQLARRLERLEARLKLIEDEQKEGIDLSKFFERGERQSPSS